MRLIHAVFLLLLTAVVEAQTAFCPDPNEPPLKWGEVPKPWKESPFSDSVQAYEDTQLDNVQILVMGYGRAVACTYKHSLRDSGKFAGSYTIFWQTLVRIPDGLEWNWMDTAAGSLCAGPIITDCPFSVG